MVEMRSHALHQSEKNMYTITHLFHIAQDRAAVYAAISSREGIQNWWVAPTTGDDQPGGRIQLHFSAQWSLTLQVVALEADKSVRWECVIGPPDWIGTQIAFQLDENEGKTRVRFSHTGFQVQDDAFAAASFSWGRYLESLRQLCQTGKGQPFAGAAVTA